MVTTAAGASRPFAAAVQPRALGVFTQTAGGCGQAFAWNVHRDATITLNTPQSSFDPQSDVAFTILGTGLGYFADRLDGRRAVYNPADNKREGIYAFLGLPGVNDFNIGVSAPPHGYAGPAPNRVGIDQVNAFFLDRATPPGTLPQGCALPMYLTAPDSDSQTVNVSVHDGGGQCVDPPPTRAAIIMWTAICRAMPVVFRSLKAQRPSFSTEPTSALAGYSVFRASWALPSS